MKRENYISWDDLYINIAELTSKRSKDPRSQHGACIVDQQNHIVSIGYNGMPNGCSDDDFSWDRGEKDNFVIHAEVNAILNANIKLDNCKLYLYSERGYYPCYECAKVIVQSGIKEVILKYIDNDPYMKDKYKGEATLKMFNAAGVKIRVLKDIINE